MSHQIPSSSQDILPMSPKKASSCDTFDSGFSSGSMVPLQPPKIVEPSSNNRLYNRLDSGICEQLESPMRQMQIVPSEKSPMRGDVQIPELSKVAAEWEHMYEPDEDGDCQLHLAIASEQWDVVFALIRMAPHPYYLNIQNNEGYAPLHIATLMNQPNIVRKLIVAGAQCDITDDLYNTALHHAAKRGFLEVGEALLRAISVEELKEAGVEPMESHNKNVSAYLNQTNKEGLCAIHLAVSGKHFNFVRFLAWNGADVNQQCRCSGESVLHVALRTNDLTLVSLLAREKHEGGLGVNINSENFYGRTPMTTAYICKQKDILDFLVKLPNASPPVEESSDSDYEFDSDDCNCCKCLYEQGGDSFTNLDDVDCPYWGPTGYSDTEINGMVVESSA